MILNPGEYFTIARELADPNDSGTYYVQAKVRNARTDVLLATINLTSRTGQRYSREYQVPVDPSGLGLYIIISTRVYTDSGYSSLSDSYGQESETYLVDNRFRQLGGGGGDDVDYKKIRAIVKDENTKVISAFDLSPILNMVSMIPGFREIALSILKRIDSRAEKIQSTVREFPEALQRIESKEFPKEVDLMPVLSAIAEIPKSVDLSPITTALEGISKLLENDDLKKNIELFSGLAESAKKVEDQLKDFLYVMAKQASPKEETPLPPTPKDFGPQARELIGAIRQKKS